MKAYADTGNVPASDLADVFARARAGEGEAFTELVERHHPELVRIAYAIAGDLDVARDAAQAAWIKAWQQLPNVRRPERLRAWLIAIAANEARQQVRARARRRVRELSASGSAGEDIDATPARLDLASALAKLDVADRQLLALRYLAGLRADEIATVTHRSAAGVRTRLSRLVQRLREDMGHD